MLCDCKRRDAALLAGVDSWKGLIFQSINLRANEPQPQPAMCLTLLLGIGFVRNVTTNAGCWLVCGR